MRFLEKLGAVMHRDMVTAVRYPGGFWVAVVGGFAEIATFYFLARAVGPGYRPDGVSYFSYLLIGTTFYSYVWLGLTTFVESVRSAQLTGTLEVLMTTSTPGAEVVLLTVISSFTGPSFALISALMFGFFLFGAQLQSPNVLAFVVVLVLALLITAAVGIVAATVQLRVQKGSAVLFLFSSAIWLLGGTVFPISTLPRPLWLVARFLPFADALNGMRGALLRGESFSQLTPVLAALGLWTVVLVPASIALFSVALRRARMSGTLSCY